ncbi:MAG: hypothetical protein QHH02_00285 [Syntrophomonadaceae bacterium]|nr:hypothetical protein [Syntrophomonadaceae bacterium]
MGSSIWLYRFYDVAEEIDLVKVEEILAHIRTTSRVKLTRFSCRSVQFRDPPVAVDLGRVKLRVKGIPVEGAFSGKIYDLGVIGITLKLDLRGKSFEEIRELGIILASLGEEVDPVVAGPQCTESLDLGREIDTGEELENDFLNQLNYVCKVLAPALIKPGQRDFMEDYTLYFFTSWESKWDPAPLLLAENSPVSSQLRDETLRHYLSYGPDDFTIITWDSALVYDASGSSEIPDLLEFAIVELLELRYYDRLLDIEMEKIYKEIEEAGRARFGRLGQYRRLMNRLMELMLDITEITERIQNSLKVTGDVFYARIYGTALTAFRTRSWMESVQRKVALVQQNYTMLNSELINQRGLMLEMAIVFLITLEIILGLMRLL